MSFASPSHTDSAVSRPLSARPAAVSASTSARPLIPRLRGLNGNSIAARRYREIATTLADDCGGPDAIDEPTRVLIRQAAGLTIEAESLQLKIVAGEAIDHEQLTRLSNVLARTLHRLGLKRPTPQKPTNPLVEHFSRPPAREAAE